MNDHATPQAPDPVEPAASPPPTAKTATEPAEPAAPWVAGEGSVYHPDERIHWPRLLKTAGVCAAIIALAAVGFVALAKSRKKAPRKKPQRSATGVRVMEVRARTIRPELTALGRARPRRVVAISAQVGGMALEVHPNLRDGVVLPAGATVVQIDSSDYAADVSRFEAQLAGAQAERARLEAQSSYLAGRIKAGDGLLALEKQELVRRQGMLRKGVGTDRELQAQQLAVLRVQDSLLALKMTQATLGPQIAKAVAQIQEAEALLTTAKLRLSRTTIKLPFSGQVAEIAVEAQQLLTAGRVLFKLWEIDRVEVPVVLPLAEAHLLTGDLTRTPRSEAGQVVVTYESQGERITWPGTLRRFEPVDGNTQTVKAVIEVDNRGQKRPLTPDLFCKVRLRAPAIEGRPVILRKALQERSRVYAVRDGTLQVLEVQTGRRLGLWVEVKGGVKPGEQVIVSPLERAIQGMKVQVIEVEDPAKVSK